MRAVQPSRLETTLRFEMASDEGQALLVSYLFATLLAVAWLVLVHLVPRPPRVQAESPNEPPIIVVVPPLEASVPSLMERTRDGGGRRLTPRAGSGSDISKIFRGDLPLVDAGRLIRGIQLTASTAAASEHARKVGLETEVGSRTPGLERAESVSRSTAGVGVVRGNGGLSRSAVVIARPEVRLNGRRASAGDVVEVGQAVRSHVPQLERCYYQEGLTRNESLAGLVRLAIDVEGGQVRSARVVERSWTGAGVPETESCLERTAQRWRLGESSARIVLPLSFTAPARRMR
jgi:hypothetical protein